MNSRYLAGSQSMLKISFQPFVFLAEDWSFFRGECNINHCSRREYFLSICRSIGNSTRLPLKFWLDKYRFPEVFWSNCYLERPFLSYGSPPEVSVIAFCSLIWVIECIELFVDDSSTHLYSTTDKVIPTFSIPRDLRSTSFLVASQSILNLISLKPEERMTNPLKLNFLYESSLISWSSSLGGWIES